MEPDLCVVGNKCSNLITFAVPEKKKTAENECTYSKKKDLPDSIRLLTLLNCPLAIALSDFDF